MDPNNNTLNELLAIEKKNLSHAKFRTFLVFAAVLILAAGLVLTLVTLRTVSAQLIPVLHGAEDALSSASDAFRNLAKIDPAAINAMTEKLGDESGGLFGTLDNLAKLDPEAINNLLNRLEDVMDVMNRLSGVLETFSGFFGGN